MTDLSGQRSTGCVVESETQIVVRGAHVISQPTQSLFHQQVQRISPGDIPLRSDFDNKKVTGSGSMDSRTQ